MVSRIKIQNFKCFPEFSVDDLGQFTIVSGHNDAGKTALLEAIYACSAPWLNVEGILLPYKARGLVGMAPSAQSLWGPLFYQFTTDRKISITLDDQLFQFSIQRLPRSEKMSGSPPQNVELQSESDGESLSVQTNGQSLYHYATESGRISTFIKYASSPARLAAFCPFRHRNPIAHQIGQAEEDNQVQQIVEYLRLLDDRIADIAIIPIGNQPIVHCDIGLAKKIPIALLGDGVSRALELLLPILRLSGGTVLMDDLDAGLHYSVQARVWNALVKAAIDSNNQIIATTHNSEFLQRALDDPPPELADQFRYVRLERSEHGVGAHVAQLEAVKAALQSNFEIR